MSSHGLMTSGRRAAARAGGLLFSTVLIFLLAVPEARAVVAAASESAAASVGASEVRNSYAEVVSRVTPAVVTVRASRRTREARQFPFFDDPFFRDFFGERFRRQTPRFEERVERGLGSGVIVTADGYILTNHHVIDGAEDIRVELSDGRALPAKVIGSDPPSDLAVLKVEAAGLPVLPLGDSDKARVGDVVLAVGNPLGVGQTVTSGIVSAKGRQTRLGDGSFEDFIQTDAPINRGNSGGALVNTNGELVGINSQIFSPTGGNIGIGFAIPANMAKDVMEQLRKTGRVRRGMLGVTVQPVTSDLATSLGLSEVRGAMVSSVQAGGPADRAGVRRGDIIKSFNGAPVSDSNSLRNMVARTQPGTEVTLTISRDNREQQLRVTLGELPADSSRASRDGGGRGGSNAGSLGMDAEPVTPALQRRYNLPAGTQGLVVTDVDTMGPAADAGLREGDVIQEVNRQPVRSVADLREALRRTGEGRPALLLIQRGDADLFLTVRPRQEGDTRPGR